MHTIKVNIKWSRYRPGVAQRGSRGIALLFHDRGTRRGSVVSSTPRPHLTPGEDPLPIVQEAGWAPGPVWKGGKSHPHRDSIPDRPARSQSLYRLSYRAHSWEVTVSVIVRKKSSNEQVSNSEWLPIYRDIWISRLNHVRFLFVGLDEERNVQKEGGYELLSVVLDAAGWTNKREYQLRRTTRDLHRRVAKCSEVDGGILERLLWTVTDLCHFCVNLSFEH
jgi:hypothetical protein